MSIFKVADEFFLFNFRWMLPKICPHVKKGLGGGRHQKDLINPPPSVYSYLGEHVREI